ncbi:basic helix-loop-helix protein [Cladochytrium tenue]|nr:basic helix-loop-helix protein [Cladochytrium tenue]
MVSQFHHGPTSGQTLQALPRHHLHHHHNPYAQMPLMMGGDGSGGSDGGIGSGSGAGGGGGGAGADGIVRLGVPKADDYSVAAMEHQLAVAAAAAAAVVAHDADGSQSPHPGAAGEYDSQSPGPGAAGEYAAHILVGHSGGGGPIGDGGGMVLRGGAVVGHHHHMGGGGVGGPAITAPTSGSMVGGLAAEVERTRHMVQEKPVVGSDEWIKVRRLNHKEVERKRRETINNGIGELQSLIPDGDKNKGKVIQRAVTYILELKQAIEDGAQKNGVEKLLLEQAIQSLGNTVQDLKEENTALRARVRQLEMETNPIHESMQVGGAGTADIVDQANKRVRTE